MPSVIFVSDTDLRNVFYLQQISLDTYYPSLSSVFAFVHARYVEVVETTNIDFYRSFS